MRTLDNLQSPAPSLTQQSVQGFLWLFSQTVITRVVNFVGQLTLAWLLEPSAFGLIALATSIQAFTTLAQQNGLNQILVARQSEYTMLANPAFWYSLVTGLVAAIVMVISAPVASRAFGHPELFGLTLIMAVAAPFDATRAVPAAKLAIDLRFGASAVANTGSMVISMLLTVALARLGFGVYSFVLPLLVVTPATTLVFFVLTRPPLRLNPDIHHWRTILGVSGMLLLTTICNRMIQRGDYLLLGAFYGPAQVGIYFMAYSLSVQTVMLFSNSLGGVLFPTLSKLQSEPRRQRAAFIRAARMMTLLTMPASVALAVVADPLVRIIFPEKWLPIIPILQVLAIGMALRTLLALADAHIRAANRFGLLLFSAILQASIFFGLAFSGAQFSVWHFTIAVSAAFIVTPVLATVLALGCTWQTLASVLHILSPPLLACLLGFAAIMLTLTILPVIATIQWLVLTVTVLILAAATLGVTKTLAPDLWSELAAIAQQLRRSSILRQISAHCVSFRTEVADNKG
jgi:lipopolysaccharide exporter